MKKLIKLLSIVLLFILAACTQQADKQVEKTDPYEAIEKKGTLVVATPGTLFPTSYHKDDKLIGYEIDMMEEIGKRIGLKIEFVEIGVAEAFTAVDSGKVDIAVNNFDKTKERLEKYNLSTPYKYSVGGAIVRADGSSGIEKSDLSDWTGKKAGGGAGTQYMKIAKKQGAEPIIYDNVTNDVYLRDVSTGRTDFIPNDYFTQVIAVKFITQQYPDIKVKMADIQYNPTEQSIVMKKENTRLNEKLNEAIEAIKKDGTLKAISEKYYAGQDLSIPLENVEHLPFVDVTGVSAN